MEVLVFKKLYVMKNYGVTPIPDLSRARCVAVCRNIYTLRLPQTLATIGHWRMQKLQQGHEKGVSL